METINVITTILTVAFGAGWGVHFLYYKYEKGKRNVELKTAELDVDAKEDAIYKSRLIQAYETLMKLQTIVDTERSKWMDKAIELSAVTAELLHEREARKFAEFGRCDVLTCPNRKPPREPKNEKE